MSLFYVMLMGIAVWSFPAMAAEWKINPDKSSITFMGTQSGQEFTGNFKTFDAVIVFDKDNLANSFIKSSVDIRSFSAGSDKARNEALPQREWLDIPNFPRATFESSSIVASPRPGQIENNRYKAEGMLTIKGVTKPATLFFELTGNELEQHAVGTMELNRMDYNVGIGEWESDQWVAFKVLVNFDIIVNAVKETK